MQELNRATRLRNAQIRKKREKLRLNPGLYCPYYMVMEYLKRNWDKKKVEEVESEGSYITVTDSDVGASRTSLKSIGKFSTEKISTDNFPIGKTSSGKIATGKSTTEKDATEKGVKEKAVTGQGTAGKVTASKDTAGKGATEKGTTGKGTTGKDTAGKDTAGKGAAGKVAARKSAARKSAAGKSKPGKGKPGKDSNDRVTIRKSIKGPSGKTESDTHLTEKDAKEKDATGKDATDTDTTENDATDKDETANDETENDATEKDATGKDVTEIIKPKKRRKKTDEDRIPKENVTVCRLEESESTMVTMLIENKTEKDATFNYKDIYGLNVSLDLPAKCVCNYRRIAPDELLVQRLEEKERLRIEAEMEALNRLNRRRKPWLPC